MIRAFPLFQTPLDFAHSLWKEALKKGGLVIDATAGNGHDTLFLLKHCNDHHKLHAFDIQESAIENSKKRIEEALGKDSLTNVHWHLASHAKFPTDWQTGSIQLLVYNLGYLPGGDKEKTTLTSTTLQSVNSALELVKPGGVITVTCYPGHPEGAKEEQVLLEMARALDQSLWSVSRMAWMNRTKSPSLLILQKNSL